MELWRRRPDAQQLGKLWPPSQPADNFEPPACVRAFVPVVQPRSDHINYQQHRRPRGQRRATNTSVFIPWYPYLGKLALGSEKGGRKTRVGCTFLYFSLAFLPQDRRLAALPRHTNSRNSCRNHLKCVKKGVQLVELALSLHIAAGECALKITWSFKWKKKRNPLAGEEFALKTDTSFSRSAILQPQGTKRVPAEGGAKLWLCNNHSRLSLLLLLSG